MLSASPSLETGVQSGEGNSAQKSYYWERVPAKLIAGTRIVPIGLQFQSPYASRT